MFRARLLQRIATIFWRFATISAIDAPRIVRKVLKDALPLNSRPSAHPANSLLFAPARAAGTTDLIFFNHKTDKVPKKIHNKSHKKEGRLEYNLAIIHCTE
jgi:hypothetical protein